MGRREDRLRRGRDFRAVTRGGKRVAGMRMVLYLLPREGHIRAGFVSGKRVGGAVERNRARRQMKEAWRALPPPASGGFDVVFAARPEIRGSMTQELAVEMEQLLKSAGVRGR